MCTHKRQEKVQVVSMAARHERSLFPGGCPRMVGYDRFEPVKGELKIVGGRNLPRAGERFDRLQRTAHQLLGCGVSPKGVFRFKTFEEFNTWKMQTSLHRVRPSK